MFTSPNKIRGIRTLKLLLPLQVESADFRPLQFQECFLIPSLTVIGYSSQTSLFSAMDRSASDLCVFVPEHNEKREWAVGHLEGRLSAADQVRNCTFSVLLLRDPCIISFSDAAQSAILTHLPLPTWSTPMKNF